MYNLFFLLSNEMRFYYTFSPIVDIEVSISEVVKRLNPPSTNKKDIDDSIIRLAIAIALESTSISGPEPDIDKRNILLVTDECEVDKHSYRVTLRDNYKFTTSITLEKTDFSTHNVMIGKDEIAFSIPKFSFDTIDEEPGDDMYSYVKSVLTSFPSIGKQNSPALRIKVSSPKGYGFLNDISWNPKDIFSHIKFID